MQRTGRLPWTVLVLGTAALGILLGVGIWFNSGDRLIHRHQQAFFAENCPDLVWTDTGRGASMDDCYREVEKRKEAASAASRATTVHAPTIAPSAMNPRPAPTPTLDPEEQARNERIKEIIEGAKNDPPEEPAPPLDKSPAGIAKVLAGVAEFQRLVQQRLAAGREPNDACQAKLEARGARIEGIEKKMGGRGWLAERKTRYACCAPNLGQTIEAPVTGCLMSCTEDDTPHNGSEEDDWGGPGGLREECQQAVTSLADWAGDLKAGRL